MSSATTFVMCCTDETFQSTVLQHIKACECLYTTHLVKVKDVYIFNFPDKEPGAIESLKSLQLWRDKRVQLFTFMSTSEILDYFSNKNVVYITGERSTLMIEADARGHRVLHNVGSMTRDSIGQTYDPTRENALLEQLCNQDGPTLIIHSELPVAKPVELPGISKAFVINLDRRPDRYTLFQTNHPRLHPRVIRTSAVDGKQIQLTLKIAHLFRKNDFKWMKGIMGCALSHYNLWKQLAESNDSAYLILEDDVKCAPDFLEQFGATMQHIPTDADVLYLGGVLPQNLTNYNTCVESVNKFIGQMKPNPYCGSHDTFFHFCTYSYVLTNQGAKKLVSKINKYGICQAIDMMLGTFISEVNIYVSIPLLTTTIQWSDPKYLNSDMKDVAHTNKYDSDICNQPERFTEEEINRVIETPLLVSYDNKPTETTLFFEDTLKRNGWSYKFIGEGDVWRGYVATRASSYKKYLELIPKESIVILSDARDVICLRGPTAFKEAFGSFGKDIVVSMELFCEGKLEPTPNHDKIKWQCEPLDKYWMQLGIKQPSRKFANAGLMAGKAGALSDMLNWIIDKGFSDDQLGVGHYMNAFPEKIAADYEAKMLHSSTFGCNAGNKHVQIQATDSPTFAELFGRSAFFLHVPGTHLKGQGLMYEQVKKMIQSGVCASMMTSLYKGFKEPGWQSYDQPFEICSTNLLSKTQISPDVSKPSIASSASVKQTRPKFDIQNEHNVLVDTEKHESTEQDLVFQHVLPEDVVLELGGRYGSVSCMINYKLKSKTGQVVVEPDERVWNALERNKLVNKCEFEIVKGFLSAKKLALTKLDAWYGGYAATSVEAPESKVPSYTLANIEERTKLKFNVLVADCEGFLETFFDENPTFIKQLRLIIFEADYPEKCNYAKIRIMLKSNGFNELLNGHQNVWII
jgi:GR25 family glycosyltransferase involved in LPS biosynthesis